MKNLNSNLREVINVYDWGFSPSQISPKTGFALVESAEEYVKVKENTINEINSLGYSA